MLQPIASPFDFPYYKKKERTERHSKLDARETAVLNVNIPASFFLPTFLKKTIVFAWLGAYFQSAKKELHGIALERTALRIGLIKKKLATIRSDDNYIHSADNYKYIDKIFDLIQIDESIKKKNILKALRKVKLLINTIDENAGGRYSSIELIEIREILVEEFSDRAYKLKIRDKKEPNEPDVYIKDKTDYKDLTYRFKIAYRVRHAAKFLNNLFTILALIGAILSLIAMIFPILAPLAAGILTVGAIGICLCAIVLAIERLAKMVVYRIYYGVPFYTWELLLNIFNLLISSILIIFGITFFISMPDGGFALHLPNVINKVIENIYVFATAVRNFLEVRSSIVIILHIWGVISYGAELSWAGVQYLLKLKGRLSIAYQRIVYGEGGIYERLPSLPDLSPLITPISVIFSSAWATVSSTASSTVSSVVSYVFPSALPLPDDKTDDAVKFRN